MASTMASRPLVISLVESELSFAQLGEKIFARMRDLFQFGETQKAATAFHRVNGAKNAGKQIRRGWIGFQLHEFFIQPVQVFIAFNQEVFYKFVHNLLPGDLRTGLCRGGPVFV